MIELRKDYIKMINQYDEDLAKLQKLNKKLKAELKKVKLDLKNAITMKEE